jgi:hypothetical protein
MPIPQGAPTTKSTQVTSVGPTTAPANKTRSIYKKSTSKQKTPEPEVAPAPVVPPTLEQMPPTAPRVSYQNGQLSINAHNSTLSQVLHSVQQQTGATIDVPGGATGERVVADLGPGRPRDVLASLLNGSHFNYVILGVPGDTGGVQRVILTARQNTVTTAQVNNAAPQQPPPAPADDDNPPEEDQTATYPDSDVQQGSAMVPGQRGNGQVDQPGDATDPNQQVTDPNQPNQVKTPEQLLQELQRMQQQQQQYQQQLNPANQQPQQEQPQ